MITALPAMPGGMNFDHDFAVGDRFDNHFQLVLPVQPGVFWPNGMQRDEDYCETGLRLSRMGKAGGPVWTVMIRIREH